jgi:drug/metabolite transporter (DMT)-like permease
LVLVSSMIGFSCYLWLLKVASPAQAASYAYVNPVVAVVLGWSVAGDPITLRILLAIVMLLGAVVLIVTTKNRGVALPPELDTVAP